MKTEIIDANAEILPPESAEITDIAEPLQDRFMLVAEYDHNAKISFAQGAAYMVMAGLELLAIKKELGVKQGRPIKGANVCTFNWKETVEDYSGLSYRTAQNYMSMADCARKQLKKSDKALVDLTSGDPTELNLLDQQQLLSCVQKITDGHTAQQLMWDWGIAKKPNGAKGGDLGGGGSPRRDQAEIICQMVTEPIYQLAQASLNDEAWQKAWYLTPLDDDEESATLGLSTICGILDDAHKAALKALDQRTRELVGK